MGGGSPSPPAPVAVPSTADVEAAEERARLYSMLRSRRAGRGLAYGPRRTSLLSGVVGAQAKKKTALPADLAAFAGFGGSPDSIGSDSGDFGSGDSVEGSGGQMGGGLSGGGGYGDG